MVTLGKTLIILGMILFAGSVAWWYAFFEQFLGEDVKKASECFYFTTDICSLSEVAEAIKISSVPAYTPAAFWVAVAILAGGAILLAVSPRHR